MMKKAILMILLFIFTFVVSLVIFFPYNMAVKKALDSVIIAKRLPVKYTDIESNIFATHIRGLVINNTEIETLNVKYSPLSLFTRKATLTAKTPGLDVVAVYRNGDVTADVSINLALIPQLINYNMKDFAITGDITLSARYNIPTSEGELTINGGKVIVKTAMLTIDANSVDGVASIKENRITISKLEVTGSTSLSMNGFIVLDTKNANNSSLNLTGKGKFMGLDTAFNIKGTVAKPIFTLQ